MDALIPAWAVQAWEFSNKVLSYPVIALLASILFGSSFLFRRVRDFARHCLTASRTWIGQLLQRWLKKACNALGLARQEDLDQLREQHGDILRRTIKATSVPAPAQAAAPRTITRAGTKITLNDEIWRYLGKEDPRHVDSGILDGLLQGPFCEKCSYSLPELSSATGRFNVIFRCPQCSHQSSKKSGSMNLTQFKESVYRGLDAEFRQTGTLKDIQ